MENNESSSMRARSAMDRISKVLNDAIRKERARLVMEEEAEKKRNDIERRKQMHEFREAQKRKIAHAFREAQKRKGAWDGAS